MARARCRQLKQALIKVNQMQEMESIRQRLDDFERRVQRLEAIHEAYYQEGVRYRRTTPGWGYRDFMATVMRDLKAQIARDHGLPPGSSGEEQEQKIEHLDEVPDSHQERGDLRGASR